MISLHSSALQPVIICLIVAIGMVVVSIFLVVVNFKLRSRIASASILPLASSGEDAPPKLLSGEVYQADASEVDRFFGDEEFESFYQWPNYPD